jgi:SpoVK/Ycf46/Vps4 family AAA+-type ATPase
MDKAFERRFLYKVKFEKPDLACRSQIWQAMIPSLEDADASFLAARYDFSGGEIENIARHYTIQTILHGSPEKMVKSLTEFCESERLEGTRAKRKIGF